MIEKIYPVTCHTDHVGKGSTFVALTGSQASGIDFIEKALSLGATRIVVDQDLTPELEAKINAAGAELLLVGDARHALSELAWEQVSLRTSGIKIIAVTGTKGKTTTTFLINHFLRAAGFKTALLGGVINKILDTEEESSLTTESSDYLAMFFKQAIQQGVEYVVMEVSSHAITQFRVDALDFDVICFTNFGTDHLDYHNTVQDYFDAKTHLFSQLKQHGLLVLNGDDAAIKMKVQRAKETGIQGGLKLIHASENKKSKDSFELLKNDISGLELQFHQTTMISNNLFGLFNAYNVAMAATVALHEGVTLMMIQQALLDFIPVPGRLNHYRLQNGAPVFIDFAHNPSSMESVLQALRPLTQDLIVVFGCGGNRDSTKRPVMGALAAEYADKIVVTEDNSRFEETSDIIEQIVAGIPLEHQHKLICEPKRSLAIARAAALSSAHSIIALLGKGHEKYLLIKGEKIPFCDSEEIKKY